MKIIHVGRIGLIVLLDGSLLFLEGFADGVEFEEQLVDAFDLREEGAVEGRADIDQVGSAQLQQLLHRVVEVLSGQEEAEVHHLYRSERHGELSPKILIIPQSQHNRITASPPPPKLMLRQR